jgi:broad specificity phosphatase PhoE
MGRIFLVRHGQTTANAQQVIQGPRIDAELSHLGQQQASRVAKALAPVPLEAVYSSPLVRARQTAQAVVAGRRQRANDGHRHLAVQVVPELYEMDYGQFIGRTYRDVEPEMEQILDAWKMGFLATAFPGGESALVAQHRIRPFCTRLVECANEADIAVVAHGRINRVLLATLTGAGLQKLEEFPQSNASITELEVNGAVTIKRLNDTGHLDLATDSFS